MVRKDQIRSSAMDIELRAQKRGRNGGALDMPPRSASAPRTRPRRFVGLRLAPEHEVQRVLLAWVIWVVAMLIGHLQPLRVVKQSCGIGQTTKRWITPHAEIYPAISHIGET